MPAHAAGRPRAAGAPSVTERAGSEAAPEDRAGPPRAPGSGRSARFFGTRGTAAGFTARAFTKSMGYTQEDLSKPVIGICQTWSEFNTCNNSFKQLAEAVKRGVWQAGGLPLEFPTISVAEVHAQPTSMLFRNLAAMDTEEMIRAQPMDAVVLLFRSPADLGQREEGQQRCRQDESRKGAHLHIVHQDGPRGEGCTTRVGRARPSPGARRGRPSPDALPGAHRCKQSVSGRA